LSKYIHRYLCDVLEEMRQAYNTRNFGGLLGLIEEAQSLGNRMEAALGEKGDWNSFRKKAKEAYIKLKTLQAKIEKEKQNLTGGEAEQLP